MLVPWTVAKFTVVYHWCVRTGGGIVECGARSDGLTKCQPNSRAHPVQPILNSNAIEDQGERCGDEARYHGWQAHLRVSNTSVSPRKSVRYPLPELATQWHAHEGANYGSNEAKTDLPGLEVVCSLVSNFDIGCDRY